MMKRDHAVITIAPSLIFTEKRRLAGGPFNHRPEPSALILCDFTASARSGGGGGGGSSIAKPPCDAERLRNQGFWAVRKYLARAISSTAEGENTAFDAYQLVSGRLDALGRLAGQLPRYVPGIEHPLRVLDLTASTGHFSTIIMELMAVPTDSKKPTPTLVINDVPGFTRYAVHAAYAKQQELAGQGRRIELEITNLDPTRPADLAKLGTFEYVFWSGINICGQRSLLMRTTLHLLTDQNSWLMIVGTYPWTPLPSAVVGDKHYEKVMALSIPVDMNGGVTDWLIREWTKEAEHEYGVILTRGTVETLRTVPEVFGQETDHRPAVHCLGFRRPF